MRSSYFYTPNHPNKICDLVVESIVQLYFNTKEIFYSKLFSYYNERKLHILGPIYSDFHFSIDEIKNYIYSKLVIECELVFLIEQKDLSSKNFNKIQSGVFLGYSNNENFFRLPFEHIECIKLSKFLYENTNSIFENQITINGAQIDLNIKTDYKNYDDIYNLIIQYLKTKEPGLYLKNNIYIEKIEKELNYQSDKIFISNAYGPRIPYSKTNFIGLDLYSNSKITHLIGRELANSFILKYDLRYCLVEITYLENVETPVQFALKGNTTGIHLENGTFLEPYLNPALINEAKDKVVKSLYESEDSILNLTKWGYFNNKL